MRSSDITARASAASAAASRAMPSSIGLPATDTTSSRRRAPGLSWLMRARIRSRRRTSLWPGSPCRQPRPGKVAGWSPTAQRASSHK